jgi:inosine/xanthosine triphosphatase
MEKVRILVGSTRRPKLAAVEAAIRDLGSVLAPASAFEVIGVEVESGVGHTPTNRSELMQGARQRAEALLRSPRERAETCQYYVGLEGGLDTIQEQGQPRVFLESWAYVSDGRHGHYGRSGAVEIPAALAREVLENGVELSVAIDRFAGAVGIRDNHGAWGYLTGNVITRQDASRLAVISAFAPFLNLSAHRPLSCEERRDQSGQNGDKQSTVNLN